MEYVQEQIATLHDYDGTLPSAPTDRAAVVVPLTERDHASLAAQRVFSTLERVDPARVYVALRATPDQVADVARWVESFEIESEVLWCNAPPVEARLAERSLAGQAGKGRDVWLALGVAAQHEYVVVHDADATTYSDAHVPKLLFPLANGYQFSKGYYARVENGRLYGRLFRLFVRPLLRALDSETDHSLVDYLLAFRYALAGEFAATSEVVRSLRVQPGWGLEIGTLGDTFDAVGFEGSAQVDLGTHEHDHRAVGGPAGLGDMCADVGAATFRALADHDVDLEYDTLGQAYREVARAVIDQYEVDAAFNGLDYDPDGERDQVEEYAAAVQAPGEDHRMPAWTECEVDPNTVCELSSRGIEDVLGQ